MFEEEHDHAYVMICQSPHKVCGVYLMGSVFRSVLGSWNVTCESGIKYSNTQLLWSWQLHSALLQHGVFFSTADIIRNTYITINDKRFNLSICWKDTLQNFR